MVAPPPIAFANAARCGCTPNRSMAPPYAMVAPHFTSSKIRTTPCGRRCPAAPGGSRPAGPMMPTFIITGSRMSAAISSPCSSARVLHGRGVVERRDDRVVSTSQRGTPFDVGCVVYQARCRLVADVVPQPEDGGLGDHGEQHRVVVPVVRALHLDDLVAAGGGPRHADGVHGGLGAGVHEPHLLHRNRAQMASASATVFSVVTAKWMASSAAALIASTIFGCAWPTTLTPNPPWQST